MGVCGIVIVLLVILSLWCGCRGRKDRSRSAPVTMPMVAPPTPSVEEAPYEPVEETGFISGMFGGNDRSSPKGPAIEPAKEKKKKKGEPVPSPKEESPSIYESVTGIFK